MKYRNLILGVLILSVLVLMYIVINVVTSQRDQIDEIYKASLDAVLAYGKEPDKTYEYIAVDLESLIGLDETAKEKMLTYFETEYQIHAMDASYMDLLELGFVKRQEEMSGLLMYVERVENHLLSYDVHVAKEFGSLGAYGIIVKFHLKEGEWRIWKIEPNWVS